MAATTNGSVPNDAAQRTIALAGGTGDLGGRVLSALARRGVAVRALVRSSTPTTSQDAVRARGGTPFQFDFADKAALAASLEGAECVVSVLNGLEPVILDLEGRLLDAAVAAGMPRFIPSDFSLDFTRTRPGDNRNMDLRRRFMARVDAAPTRATSILNGAFADLLTGEAPIVLPRFHRILFWGRRTSRSTSRRRKMSRTMPLRWRSMPMRPASRGSPATSCLRGTSRP